VPSLKLHAKSGQFRAWIGGRYQYFGTDRGRASRRYDRALAEWLSAGRPTASKIVTVAELVTRFMENAETYYPSSGRYGGERVNFAYALGHLEPLAKMPAESFGPQQLRAVREGMIAQGLARTTINGRIRRIRQVWRWGAAEGLIDSAVLTGLGALQQLKRGRTSASETAPVEPVHESHIEAVRRVVRPVVAAILDLQLLTAMRPGEVTTMRGCDIEWAGTFATYQPLSHKSAWRGKARSIELGPRSQAIVREWLQPDLMAYLFTTKHGNPYAVRTLRTLVVRACEKAGVPEFSPNQIRHTALQRYRREFGIETARIVAGHSHMDTTMIYTARDRAIAREAAQRLG